jgi:hypothetical protein
VQAHPRSGVGLHHLLQAVYPSLDRKKQGDMGRLPQHSATAILATSHMPSSPVWDMSASIV